MADGSELVFLPLGGVGEIGMNLGLYGVGPPEDRKWLMVDCGVTFGDASTPGVDLILPDIRFIEAERDNLAGIVITHAHEDHIGALGRLWPRLGVPVHLGPFAAGLFEAKQHFEGTEHKVPLEIVRAGDRVSIGPFEVEFVAMSHSIPEPLALAITTEAGTVFHTADWKLDAHPGVGIPIDRERIAAIGAAGIDALVCDSTNVMRTGESPSEADVAASLRQLILDAPHRVAVTTFSSHLARIIAVARAAQEAEREVVVVGRAFNRVLEVAGELGYLEGLPPFHDEETAEHLPRRNTLLLCTGSQGEQRAALARIANGEHRRIRLSRGDRVIFSSWTIPGNERSVLDVVNRFAEDGVDVVTGNDALVHVTGHPRRDEVAEMYRLVKPKVAVPVHGEPLHLERHARLAKSLGATPLVMKNGEIARLAPGPAEVIDDAPHGRLYLDGHLLLDPELSGMRSRRKLSFVGHIAIAVVLDRRGELLAEPEIGCSGLPEPDLDGDSMEERIGDAVSGALSSIPRNRRRNTETLRQAVARAARAEARGIWGKKPVCQVLVTVL